MAHAGVQTSPAPSSPASSVQSEEAEEVTPFPFLLPAPIFDLDHELEFERELTQELEFSQPQPPSPPADLVAEYEDWREALEQEAAPVADPPSPPESPSIAANNSLVDLHPAAPLANIIADHADAPPPYLPPAPAYQPLVLPPAPSLQVPTPAAIPPPRTRPWWADSDSDSDNDLPF